VVHVRENNKCVHYLVLNSHGERPVQQIILKWLIREIGCIAVKLS
jgi:hypothetical protein